MSVTLERTGVVRENPGPGEAPAPRLTPNLGPEEEKGVPTPERGVRLFPRGPVRLLPQCTPVLYLSFYSVWLASASVLFRLGSPGGAGTTGRAPDVRVGPRWTG